MNEERVSRSVGHCGKASQHLVRSERHTGGVTQQHEIENEGIRWQTGHALLHLLKGKIIVVSELDSTRERFGCLLESLLPGALERRRPHYNRDIFCRGRNLQDVFKQAWNVQFMSDVGRVLVQRPGRKQPRIGREVEDGCIWEEAVA